MHPSPWSHSPCVRVTVPVVEMHMFFDLIQLIPHAGGAAAAPLIPYHTPGLGFGHMPCACCGVWVAKPTWLPCTEGDPGLFSGASGSLRVDQSTGQLLRCFCEVCVLQRAVTANLAAARCYFKPDVAEGVEQYILHRLRSLVQELSGTVPATLRLGGLGSTGSSSSGPRGGCRAQALAQGWAFWDAVCWSTCFPSAL